MAKNVSITEDGSAKVLNNVEKIKTSIQEGGTCLWVPKDDFPVGIKNVTEDGTYNPVDDNLYAYSKVVASGIGNTAMGRLITKSVTKNGTYNITDESGNPYGYSSFTVNVDTSDDSGGDSGASDPITGKDEDGNDAMVEEDDGDVTVTILPTHIKVVIPPKKLEYDRYEEIDYDGIVVYAYISKMPHAIGTTTVEVSEGSTNPVVGIGGQSVTANTGDMILYAPDRTGLNDVQLVWDGEKWVKASEYISEESVWKSKDYPTGKIPFEELIFPYKRLNYDEENDFDTKVIEKNDIVAVEVNASNYYFSKTQLVVIDNYNYGSGSHSEPEFIPTADALSNEIRLFTVSTNEVYLFSWVVSNTKSEYKNWDVYVDCDVITRPELYNQKIPIGISITDEVTMYSSGFGEAIGSYIKERLYNVEFLQNNTSGIYSIDSNGIYIEEINSIMHSLPLNIHNGVDDFAYYIPLNIIDSTSFTSNVGFTGSDLFKKQVLPKLFNGEYNIIKPMAVPVQWKRPGDGKTLETSFTVWIKDDVDAVSGADPVASQS